MLIDTVGVERVVAVLLIWESTVQCPDIEFDQLDSGREGSHPLEELGATTGNISITFANGLPKTYRQTDQLNVDNPL